MRTLAFQIVASGALAQAALAQPQVPQRQAAIDGASSGGIRDWHADDDRGIFLRDRTNRWYYAAFTHNCPGVLRQFSLGFDTFGDSRFDRSSRVLTGTESCALSSVTESPAPFAKGGLRKR